MNDPCEQVDELWDDKARALVDHLARIEVRDAGWTVLYECPKTRIRWLKEYPQSSEQGGGPLRLRKVKPAGG